MTNNIKDLRAKLLIIGDSSVGKSSILSRFTDDTFHSHIPSTYGIDYRTKKVTINNETVKLEVWDTAGQERFKAIGQNFYRGCMGIIIAFDLTNRDSFNNVEKWIKGLKDETDDNVVKVVVGNKIDMKREVTKEEIHTLLAANHNFPYFETSAKTGEKINEVFSFLAKQVYKKFLRNLTDSIIGGDGDDPNINVNPARITLMKKDVEEKTEEKKKCCGSQ